MTKDADKASGALIRRRWHRAARYGVVCLGVCLIVNGLVGDKGVLQMLKKRQEARMLEDAVLAARAENARLRAEVNRLRHDPNAVEELARRKLGMIKRGEKVYMFRDARPATPPPPAK